LRREEKRSQTAWNRSEDGGWIKTYGRLKENRRVQNSIVENEGVDQDQGAGKGLVNASEMDGKCSFAQKSGVGLDENG